MSLQCEIPHFNFREGVNDEVRWASIVILKT